MDNPEHLHPKPETLQKRKLDLGFLDLLRRISVIDGVELLCVVMLVRHGSLAARIFFSCKLKTLPHHRPPPP